VAGVYFCKFSNQKYIFVKNKNIKYKNKKTAPNAQAKPGPGLHLMGGFIN